MSVRRRCSRGAARWRPSQRRPWRRPSSGTPPGSRYTPPGSWPTRSAARRARSSVRKAAYNRTHQCKLHLASRKGSRIHHVGGRTCVCFECTHALIWRIVFTVSDLIPGFNDYKRRLLCRVPCIASSAAQKKSNLCSRPLLFCSKVVIFSQCHPKVCLPDQTLAASTF